MRQDKAGIFDLLGWLIVFKPSEQVRLLSHPTPFLGVQANNLLNARLARGII
jgi:hypothetical protein